MVGEISLAIQHRYAMALRQFGARRLKRLGRVEAVQNDVESCRGEAVRHRLAEPAARTGLTRAERRDASVTLGSRGVPCRA
jgi:hypothetical protein